MRRRDRYRLKLKFALASAVNYAEGYAWDPVRRWRCCGHTTPFHAAGCWLWTSTAAEAGHGENREDAVSGQPWMHADPRQVPADLKEPAMDAGYPPDQGDGLDVTEEGEQCIDCLRFGYDPHQDVCLLCGHGQLRDDYDDDSMADIIPEDWRGEAW